MYCIKCGVKLADTEKVCPLCRTTVYHPEIQRESADPLYPINKYPPKAKNTRWPVSLLATIIFVLPMIIVLMCDMQFNGNIEWSGYVIGALLCVYVFFVLPSWFLHPNPVIFVPCDFACVALYLTYINYHTGGDWFWTFALPVVTGVALLVCAVVTLMKYVSRGSLFIFGGAFLALGTFMIVVEYLVTVTFNGYSFIGWSLYPLVTFVLLGLLLIFFGICRPAREIMRKRFFI